MNNKTKIAAKKGKEDWSTSKKWTATRGANILPATLLKKFLEEKWSVNISQKHYKRKKNVLFYGIKNKLTINWKNQDKIWKWNEKEQFFVEKT